MAKKNKNKKVKRQIRLYFHDGKSDIIPARFWDDYEINDGLFIVKKNGAWIAGYKMSIIDCFVVTGL